MTQADDELRPATVDPEITAEMWERIFDGLPAAERRRLDEQAGRTLTREEAWPQFQATRQRLEQTFNRRMRRGRNQRITNAVDRNRRLDTMRQRQRSEEPAAPQDPPFLIAWCDPDYWSTPQGKYAIPTMVDQHLWETVIWCVRNVETLFPVYNRVHESMLVSLASRKWLVAQTAFRALLQEAIRRQLTFPSDVHECIRKYALKRDGQLDSYQPWRDPAARALQADLQEFLAEPVTAPEDYGKDFRALEL